MYISKKELLSITGISYGQLYRWKRERLIPEEWFIKQSSYTGQETFFPREQILNRIQAIQDLKDKHSLEEVAKLLSPEVGESEYPVDELKYIEEIHEDIIPIFEEVLNYKSYSYIEVIIMVILSGLKIELNLKKEQIVDIIEGMKPNISDLKTMDYILDFYKIDTIYYTVFYQEQTSFYLDKRFQFIKKYRMDDISNDLKIKYHNYFDIGKSNINYDYKKSNHENNNQQPTYEHNANGQNTEEQNTEGQNAERQNADGQNYKEQSNYQQNNDYNKQNTKSSYNKQVNSDDFVLKINNWEVRL